jgi:protein involved in polysaccharide export with SLBB domain
MSPESDSSAASSEDDVFVVGFVKALGRYSLREGMTVEDPIDEAGGYVSRRNLGRAVVFISEIA